VFDERFFIYYNDMDWCFRMRRAGWKITYVHEAEVVHFHGKTVSTVNKDFAFFDELYNNTMLFYWKHYGPLAVVAYKFLLLPGFLVRAVGWGVYRLMRPTPHVRHMALFCWKTLGVGLTFWKPLPRTTTAQL
jgi:GT2 family glycosyltransferase